MKLIPAESLATWNIAELNATLSRALIYSQADAEAALPIIQAAIIEALSITTTHTPEEIEAGYFGAEVAPLFDCPTCQRKGALCWVCESGTSFDDEPSPEVPEKMPANCLTAARQFHAKAREMGLDTSARDAMRSAIGRYLDRGVIPSTKCLSAAEWSRVTFALNDGRLVWVGGAA
jgi:hypothetical protein